LFRKNTYSCKNLQRIGNIVVFLLTFNNKNIVTLVKHFNLRSKEKWIFYGGKISPIKSKFFISFTKTGKYLLNFEGHFTLLKNRVRIISPDIR
jgi:hypothetical protein